MQLVFSLKATEFLVEGIKYQTEDRRRNFESTHLYSLTVTILYPYALWIFKSRKETASFLNQTFKISALMKISALVHSSSLSHPISFKDPHFDQFSPLPSLKKELHCTIVGWDAGPARGKHILCLVTESTRLTLPYSHWNFQPLHLLMQLLLTRTGCSPTAVTASTNDRIICHSL